MAVIGEMQYLTIGSKTYSIPTSGGSTVSITRSLLSGTKSATITVDGTGYDIYSVTNTDENLKTVALTSGTTYYPVLATGANAAANRQVDSTLGGLKYVSTAGTTSTVGTASLYLGNATASGTANNEQGLLRFYGSGSHYIDLKASDSSNNWQLFIPAASGTAYNTNYNLVGANSVSAAVGGATQPVYIAQGGLATTCSTYAGGTAVTLNGTSAAASTASFYAPTSAGTSGYVLRSNGSGAPSWVSVDSSISDSSSSTNLPTSAAVATFIEGKGYSKVQIVRW